MELVVKLIMVKNIVVSHKALIEAILKNKKNNGQLEKGRYLGTVKNITSYGVFIDLGGVDGNPYYRPVLG